MAQVAVPRPSRDFHFRSSAAALWALHRAAEAGLLQDYRARIAAARLCYRPEQIAAAVAQIVSERDAALRALRAKHRSERREARSIALKRMPIFSKGPRRLTPPALPHRDEVIRPSHRPRGASPSLA